jgi:hypothetical protein
MRIYAEVCDGVQVERVQSAMLPQIPAKRARTGGESISFMLMAANDAAPPGCDPWSSRIHRAGSKVPAGGSAAPDQTRAVVLTCPICGRSQRSR